MTQLIRNTGPGVQEWYSGKNIFITGGTGFMGKVLVEKLLRDCPDLNTLYLLIRSKRGQEPSQRKEEFFKCIIFNTIRRNNPDQLKKVKIIKGDVCEENLGLNENDRNELLSNVDIIFHCAANVRFDQPLKQAVQMNTIGVYSMIQLAENMAHLKVFVHVSTAYSQCKENIVEEKMYLPPHEPMGIIEMVKTLDESVLDKITEKLLDGLPNTYSYTKALGEGVLTKYGHGLPIVICRPSIVTAAKKEPLPGWVEGLNGPSGISIGAGRGIIRSMHCNPDYPADIIPVDTAINAIICAGWQRGQSNSKEVEFFNVVLSHKNLLTWGESIETGRRILYENPLCFALWFPDGSIKSNYYMHLLSVIFFHYLPAYFIDMILIVIGQKPFLVKVQKKVSVGLEMLQYYTTKVWVFKNDKLRELRIKLNEKEKEIFDMAIDQLNWDEYIYNYILGLRHYLLKEPPETLPQARIFMKRLYILDRCVSFAFYCLILYFIYNYLEVIFNVFGLCLTYTKNLFTIVA